MKPLKLPRGWIPWPPQLAAERNGTSTLGRWTLRSRCQSSHSGCFFTSVKTSVRFFSSSCSERVTGPATDWPVLGFLGARSPWPYWTGLIWVGCQRRLNSLRIPPWYWESRYWSLNPSQAMIAAR
jgi:hypothetical protein